MESDPRCGQAARVILFFDANLPVTDGCLECSAPEIHITPKPKTLPRPDDTHVDFNRARDLEIAEWCFSEIRNRYTDAQGVVMAKHYVLATQDQKFIGSARNENAHRAEKKILSRPGSLVFTKIPNDASTICATQGLQIVTLKVLTLSSSVSGRDHEMTVIRTFARKLLSTLAP